MKTISVKIEGNVINYRYFSVPDEMKADFKSLKGSRADIRKLEEFEEDTEISAATHLLIDADEITISVEGEEYTRTLNVDDAYDFWQKDEDGKCRLTYPDGVDSETKAMLQKYYENHDESFFSIPYAYSLCYYGCLFPCVQPELFYVAVYNGWQNFMFDIELADDEEFNVDKLQFIISDSSGKPQYEISSNVEHEFEFDARYIIYDGKIYECTEVGFSCSYQIGYFLTENPISSETIAEDVF